MTLTQIIYVFYWRPCWKVAAVHFLDRVQDGPISEKVRKIWSNILPNVMLSTQVEQFFHLSA